MATEDAVMAVIKAYRPTLRNPHDKLVFALHAAFLASGYTLTATGPPASAENALSSPPSDEVGIEGWNESEDSYAFLYSKKSESGLKNAVLVKSLVMGDQLVIDALSSKKPNKEPINLQINVNDYDGGNDSKNYTEQYKNFGKLVKTLTSQIVSKMDSSVSPSSFSSASSRSGKNEVSEQKLYEPQGPEPGYVSRRPHEPQGPEPGIVYPPVFPSGHDDLFPGPGAGVYPRIGPGGGGSMLVGPSDPRWFQPEGGQPGFPGGAVGVPPGARFDPYGPPGVPGFEPNRFVRNPRRPPGTHPDLEHFGNPDFI